jgi:hypothetical protein
MKINRREILKLGIGVLTTAVISPFVFAQLNKANGSAGSESSPKLDGVVTYNAGWIIPLEDRPALLELEAKKNKDSELAKQKAAGATPPANVKENSKSIGSRFQEALAKVKSFF